RHAPSARGGSSPPVSPTAIHVVPFQGARSRKWPLHREKPRKTGDQRADVRQKRVASFRYARNGAAPSGAYIAAQCDEPVIRTGITGPHTRLRHSSASPTAAAISRRARG